MPDKSNKWWRAEVIEGRKLGKQLSYPTANLRLPEHWRLGYGIYTTHVRIGSRQFCGVLYWGTLGGTRESLEIHLFDFDGDLYGQTLVFQVGEFIREDRAMASEQHLKKQIAYDIIVAKQLLEVP